jgi:hypothetical protein
MPRQFRRPSRSAFFMVGGFPVCPEAGPKLKKPEVTAVSLDGNAFEFAIEQFGASLALPLDALCYDRAGRRNGTFFFCRWHMRA